MYTITNTVFKHAIAATNCIQHTCIKGYRQVLVNIICFTTLASLYKTHYSLCTYQKCWRGPKLFRFAFGFVSRVIKVQLYVIKNTSQNSGLWNVCLNNCGMYTAGMIPWNECINTVQLCYSSNNIWAPIKSEECFLNQWLSRALS